MADELRTARLVLRRATMEDTGAMHRVMSDPTAMRYWSTPPHRSMDETERWMRSMVDADLSTSDDFIVTLDGALIGKLGAWKLPEIGFLLARETWGQGYAGEALSAFLEHRKAAGSDRLTADVDPRNEPSLRLLQGHGFVESGRAKRTWLVGDEWCDSVYLEVKLT
jgi:RimJ/RimL family protein N-acetyltransferase